MNGVLPINKPSGWTSFDVVAKIRNILKIKKIGHMGTLDPITTGVLLVTIGKSTKLFHLAPNHFKEYIAGFKFGLTTDTLDITGNILSNSKIMIDSTSLSVCLPKFYGEILQIVPSYSAVKINGKKLYERARKGEPTELPIRKVTIKQLELLNYNYQNQEGTLLIGCLTGTYVRALVSDIGRDLHCGATMTTLVRTKNYGINLDQTITIAEVEQLEKAKQLHKYLLCADYFFNDYAPIKLSQQNTLKFQNGVKLNILTQSAMGYVRVYGSDDTFLGLGIIDSQNILSVGKLLV
ncbi:MAG: tRNA pseudouridine(55) synthase TruB [Oscillospiraceae bacterium]|jgi:tRNA pseudouridine55 synthase|nr:tRNA pseudouridine(55) synthase TruB [Oscillospiraceae bacterium]